MQLSTWTARVASDRDVASIDGISVLDIVRLSVSLVAVGLVDALRSYR